MKNNSAAAVTTPQQKPEVKEESPKVVPITVTDPREQKIQNIIAVGKLIRKRSQLNEELAVLQNLHFDDSSKVRASVQISDSGDAVFENENPTLVSDLHEAARQSYRRQINGINSQIDAFTC